MSITKECREENTQFDVTRIIGKNTKRGSGLFRVFGGFTLKKNNFEKNALI